MSILKTPRGKVQWAKVVVPDTKFDANGVYSVDLLLKADDPATQEMCETLDKQVQEAVAKQMDERPERFKSLPAGQPLTANPYSEEDNGLIKFKFKLKARGKTKAGEEYTQRPIVVDAKGQSILRIAEDGRVMNNSFSIGNGSTCVVHYQMIPYFVASTKQCGVSLRLKAIQVFQLEKYKAGGMDFEESDEFTYEDENSGFNTATKETSTQVAGDENGDF